MLLGPVGALLELLNQQLNLTFVLTDSILLPVTFAEQAHWLRAFSFFLQVHLRFFLAQDSLSGLSLILLNRGIFLGRLVAWLGIIILNRHHGIEFSGSTWDFGIALAMFGGS